MSALAEATDAFHQYAAIAGRNADGQVPLHAVWSAYADYAGAIARLAGCHKVIFFSLTLPATVAITPHPSP